MRWVIYSLLPQLSHSICHTIDEYCLSCHDEKCTVCVGTYLNQTTNHCQVPAQNISNCMLYSESSSCISCQLGYYAYNGTCTAIKKANCAIASPFQYCKACYTRHAPINGTCESKDLACPANCKYCSHKGEQASCVLCDKGWSIRYDKNGVGKCEKSDSVVPNCMVLSRDNCLICRYGYYMINGICIFSNAYPFFLESALKFSLSALIIFLFFVF